MQLQKIDRDLFLFAILFSAISNTVYDHNPVRHTRTLS